MTLSNLKQTLPSPHLLDKPLPEALSPAPAARSVKAQAASVLCKGFVFLFINVLVLLAIASLTSAYVQRRPYTNAQVDSNLLIMPSNQAVDLIIFGTSHGRNFARKGNHERVEKILGWKVANLSIGGGGGVVPASLMLDIFHEHHNQARKIVYFIDPFVLYSRQWNEGNDRFARREPFSLYFFGKLLQHQIDPVIIKNYIQSKVSWTWLKTEPDLDKLMQTTVRPEQLTKARIAARNRAMFLDDTDTRNYERYSAVLESMIRQAQARGSEFILVIPPTMFDEGNRAEMLRNLLSRLKRQYGVKTYDHSKVIGNHRFFEDPDHLNTYGVSYYTQQYLLPMLNGRPVPRHRLPLEANYDSQAALEHLAWL